MSAICISPCTQSSRPEGGNEIRIVEFGAAECGNRLCNLHFAWDIGLIEHSHRSEKQYSSDLEDLIARRHLSSDAHGSAEHWANESFQLAKKVWVNEGGSIDESYFRANIGVLDNQLALAGIRLASLLNDTLAGH